LISLYKIICIFFGYVKEFPTQFLLLLTALLIEVFLGIASVLSVIPIADFIVDETLKSPSIITKKILSIFTKFEIEIGFYSFSSLFIIINFLKAFLEVFTKFIIYKTKYIILSSIISKTLKLLLEARWSFLNKQNQGKLINSFTREAAKMGDMLGSIANGIVFFIQLCIYISIPIIINPVMSISAIILIFIFSLPFFYIQKLSFKLGKNDTDTANSFIDHLNETLNSIKLVLIFNNQDKTIYKNKNLYDTHARAAVKSNLLIISNSILFHPLSILAIMISVGISIENGSRISEIAAVIWSFFRAMPCLGKLIHINTTISNFLPSFYQISDFQKQALKSKEMISGQIFLNVKKNIEISNLKFSYNKKPVLNNVNLKIKTRQITAITGPSGSGKSTLIDLLMAFQLPSSGHIFIDNIDIIDLDFSSYRNKIGYVPQDPLLLNDTIKENLLWASPQATDENIVEACKKANALKFIQDLDYGFDTIVGNRGTNLSGGQRQRITLARALLKNPEIIILDEATSSLDTESENLIQSSLKLLKKECTIIIVAHRASTLRIADQIYVIKNGKVIEKGNFLKLQSKKKSYTKNIKLL